MSLLVGLLWERWRANPRTRFCEELDTFLRTAVRSETLRNSIRRHCSDVVGLLALRITESASRTGEHYITTDWAGYRALLFSAMGAGFIIAFMALGKLYVIRQGLPPGDVGLANSLNYGLGFVLIALEHFTIATKQPAMTAAKIAEVINARAGELREDGPLVSLIVDTLRSQLAAILGNVLLAVGTASALAWALTGYFGHPPLDPAEAEYLLGQVNALGPLNLVYAAIAGFWLFLAGILAGYFDNLSTYARLRERLARLPWLKALLGPDRAPLRRVRGR
jgi:site-specific recombinase